MSYINALADIKKGLLNSIYLIHGEEVFYARQLEQAIVNALLKPEERDMNLNILSGDPQPQELLNLIETVPFFGDKNVIIVRGSNLFRSRKGAGDHEKDGDQADEALLKVLSHFPDYATIIFKTTEKVDKRRKIYKNIEKNGTVVEVSLLKPKDVKVWLPGKLNELNKRMSPDAQEHFLAVVSVMSQISLGFLDNELEKIALYSSSQIITKNDLVDAMSAIPEVSVFAMIDAVSQKHTQDALRLFNEQLAAGEHPIKILALLNRQVRLLWQAKSLLSQGRNNREIADELGLMSFVGDKLIKQCQRFAEKTLKETVISLADADRDLKSGRATNVALEKIIIDMCR
ncbi:DNA polymerase III subunit delta [Sporomusaceae bacterium FL31]|nr:DNA polymerase III subunit delta [Sporomusaceae bacterium FL31]GCE32413.1 DNA polymerase III subunit delta [Sporomusaceae bacterium]